MKLQVIDDRPTPSNISQCGLVHIEVERAGACWLGLKFNIGTVGDQFVHNRLRVLRLEFGIAAEWRDEDVRADGLDAAHVPAKYPEVVRLHDELLNRYELRTRMPEFDAVEDASWRKEGGAIILHRDDAVSGLAQVLENGFLVERPESGKQNKTKTGQSGADHDEGNRSLELVL